MRVLAATTLALAMGASAAACGKDELRPPIAPRAAEARSASSREASGPPQYLVADPAARGGGITVALGTPGSFGLVVDKMRIVVGRGEPRVAPDGTDEPIAGAVRIPARFGGGFLFWTERSLYRADAFDAPLRPVVRVPDTISTVSFASRFLLVRSQNGERWAIGLPSGERKAIEPLGVADVEALDDGRTLAFDDEGAAFASTDGGDHWATVTAQLNTPPARVAVVDGELWMLESGGAALRLERDGRLTAFDKAPPEAPPSIRPRDPKWRGRDAPLRSSFHGGAAVDEGTAILVEDGDVVRVDVRTGEVVSAVPGRLPPDAQCEAVPTANDVLFACASRGGTGGGTAFVVARTLGVDVPSVEQSFGSPAPFYASDDGGLAYGGPCGGASPGGATPDASVCVRQPGGAWREHDLSGLQSDGGAAEVRLLRWVPRADGRVVALVLEQNTPAVYDPQSGSLVTLAEDARDLVGASGPFGSLARLHKKTGVFYRPDAAIVDTSWTFEKSGALRGWQRTGGIAAISEDGRITRSPYSFEIVASGPYALGRTKEGRLYQSTDHGASWAEVEAPPSGASAVELRRCSTAGCDLGAFYRVGWSVRPPRVEAAKEIAKPAPLVRRAAGVTLSCRTAGAPATKILARTAASPDDLGLGTARLPVAGERSSFAYLRNPILRQIVHPLHDGIFAGDGDALDMRALLSGYQTSREQDVIEVMGPNKNAAQLRRPLAWVPAFDPAARIAKATIAMSDVLAVGRGAGMSIDEILGEDMTETGNVIHVTPVDPGAPAELVFHNPRGLVVYAKGDRPRLAMRSAQDDAAVVSGVALGADEVALLEVESTGAGHVFKMAGGGTTPLFDVAPTVNDIAYYPANPDALAVGPKSELGILRTPSGSDPASAWDPAVVVVPSSAPVRLAPFADIELEGSPACKEPGWRTTLQVIAPWVRIETPDLRVEEAPMIARVKWNERRVCLEALEVKVPSVTVRATGGDGVVEPVTVSTWLVAKGRTFARVGIAEGVEWRQPLECAIAR